MSDAPDPGLRAAFEERLRELTLEHRDLDEAGADIETDRALLATEECHEDEWEGPDLSS